MASKYQVETGGQSTCYWIEMAKSGLRKKDTQLRIAWGFGTSLTCTPPFKVSNSTGNIFKTGSSELRPGHGKRRKLAWGVNHSSRGCLEGLPADLLSMQSSFSVCSIEIKEKHIAFFNDLGSHLQSLELEYSSIWEGQGTLSIEFTKAFKSFGCEW